MNPQDQILEQVRAMRTLLLSEGVGRLGVSRATGMLHIAMEEGRDPTLGEITQTIAMLLVMAEQKLLEGLS